MKITFIVIGICIAVFLLQLSGIFPQNLAFTPATFKEQPYTIITSMFMHSGFQHILFNMIGLFTFGTMLEMVIGKKEWIILYFASGFIASLGYAVMSSSPFIPAVGASGAIFGLIGGMALLRPKQIIYTAYGPIPMAAAAVVWGAIELLSMFSLDNIAHSAHLFGLFGGIIIAYMVLRKLSWKHMLAVLIIPPVILSFAVLNLPSEIYAPGLNLPDCYVLKDKTEQTGIKAYLYGCGENLVFELVQPAVGKFNLANYAEQVPTVATAIYRDYLNLTCNASVERIDSVDNIAIIGGKICEHYFLGNGLICNGSDITILQLAKAKTELNENIAKCT